MMAASLKGAAGATHQSRIRRARGYIVRMANRSDIGKNIDFVTPGGLAGSPLRSEIADDNPSGMVAAWRSASALVSARLARRRDFAQVSLSEQAHPSGAALWARRHRRLCRPHAQPATRARISGSRWSPKTGRRRRHPGHRQVARVGARRLHAAADGSRLRHQSDLAARTFRTTCSRRLQTVSIVSSSPEVLVVALSLPVNNVPRAHRLRQGQSRQAQLRLGRHRHHAASRRRDVQAAHRRSTPPMSRIRASARPTPT